jgi:hypothetical protein
MGKIKIGMFCKLGTHTCGTLSVCLSTTAVLCITDMDTHCVCCCDMQEQQQHPFLLFFLLAIDIYIYIYIYVRVCIAKILY